MFERSKSISISIWKRFRGYSGFIQLILIVPVICAIAFTLIVGNMGLALMGTAVAINALLAGWIGGFILTILGKAGIIIAKDRKKSRSIK
jgi:uncharacterized membrane protein